MGGVGDEAEAPLSPSLARYEVAPRHGSFHFAHDQGPVQGITWNRTTWRMGFDEANTSQLSVLLTGNSSVQTLTSNCQPEGCPPDTEFWCDGGCGPRYFYWSCGMQNAAGKCWNVTGDASIDIPSHMSTNTIWEAWTVILDTSPPVLNRLTIRGRLIFLPNAGERIELRAHWVRGPRRARRRNVSAHF